MAATRLTASDIYRYIYGPPDVLREPVTSAFDPTGGDLQRQALDEYLARRAAQRATDYGASGNAIDAAVHNTGPLPDPMWAGFFQALKNRNVDNVVGGDSPTGWDNSHALRGVTAQPNYFTGSGDTFMGRTSAIGALKRKARPMALDQDAFETQLYAARGRPGTDVTPPPAATPTKASTLQRPLDAPYNFIAPQGQTRTPSPLTDDEGAALAFLKSRART